MSRKLILGMKYLNRMVLVYWETIHCLFILNVSYISQVLVTFHLILYDVGFVDRGLTKFQDCGFLYARKPCL